MLKYAKQMKNGRNGGAEVQL